MRRNFYIFDKIKIYIVKCSQKRKNSQNQFCLTLLFSHVICGVQEGAGDWTNMIIPSVEISRATLVTYRLQFSLHSLKESTSYEVIIQTRNRAGWSQSSDIFLFTTSPSPRLAIRDRVETYHWFLPSRYCVLIGVATPALLIY